MSSKDKDWVSLADFLEIAGYGRSTYYEHMRLQHPLPKRLKHLHRVVFTRQSVDEWLKEMEE